MQRTLSQETIRNLGIVAHIDAGKTTISERILRVTGRIWKIGEVHDGQATLDFLKEERERGITIAAASTYFRWAGCHVNLIDTPGHVDFTAEVERSLRVLDGAILAIDAVAGVQAQTETVNRQMDKYDVARIVFVNKMDRPGADFAKAVRSARARLGLNAAAIQLPVGEGPAFRGLVDLVRLRQYEFPEGGDDPSEYEETEIDPELAGEAERARGHLVEALALSSEDIFEEVLGGREPEPEVLASALRRAVCRRHVVPCLLGAALRNAGIPQLLDAAVAYLPSPLEKGAIPGVVPGTGEPVAFEPSPEAPFGAIVFKTVGSAVGDLTFLRIASGRLCPGTSVYNPRLGRSERVGRLFRVHAAKREPIDEACAGDIVACLGLREAATGDTLSTKERPIAYGATTFARPVISVAIEPASSQDRDRLGQALARLVRDDPTFHVSVDEETGETIASGMGELHLEVLANRIRDEYRIPVLTGAPRIAYRQTLAGPARVEARHVKQTGGAGQFAVAVIEFEPIEGDAVEFVDRVTQGRISRELIVALEKGLRAYFLRGGRKRAQIQGVRATVVDGKMHEVDSNSNAFHACGMLAGQLAEERCGTVLLEPVMRVEVDVPEEHLGAVLGDLASRRAAVEGLEDRPGGKTVFARAPLAELREYATTLRSLTSGRGSASVEPRGYEPAPPGALRELAGARS
ncbi:MAG: elongation factor G [Planctomycetota bacterium]